MGEGVGFMWLTSVSAAFFPLIYCLLTGCSWAIVFHCPFCDSLAPALMFQSLLLLLCGLMFPYGGLKIGLTAGIIISAAVIVWWRFRGIGRDAKSFRSIISSQRAGIILFVLLYFFIFAINVGKRFVEWDEMSHWGRFLKECLRLDSLYCVSDAPMSHKDYVPVITVFEYIFCRLSLRYAEADAYRAQQVLMIAMIIPSLNSFFRNTAKSDEKRGFTLPRWCMILAGAVILLLIPLFFDTRDGFKFYHTVYNDYIFGVALFYCVLVCFKYEESFIFRSVTAVVSFSFLIMTKMTAAAFLPPLWLLMVLCELLFDYGSRKGKLSILFLTLPVPALLWVVYNRFVEQFVVLNGIQSYSGLSISSLLGVIFHPDQSGILYVQDVKSAYFQALFHEAIAFGLNYGICLIVLTVCLLAIGFLWRTFNRTEASGLLLGKTSLCALWVILTGIYHAVLMYALYCTSFSEYEAVHLASYARYMNTFLVTAVMLVIFFYYDSGLCERFHGSLIIISVLLAGFCLLNRSMLNQMLPGIITKDEKKVRRFEIIADKLKEETGETDRVFILSRGDDGFIPMGVGYFALPRVIDGGSFGTRMDESDYWSEEIPRQEFVSRMSGYDWLYLNRVDDLFREEYSASFADDIAIEDGKLYLIDGIDQLSGKLKVREYQE